MRDDAEFLRSIIRQYHLDIVDLQDSGTGRPSPVAQLGARSGGSLRSRAADSAQRQSRSTSQYPYRNQPVRQAGQSYRAACAAERRASQICLQQSAKLNKFRNQSLSFVRGPAILSDGRARICRPILPLASQRCRPSIGCISSWQ